MAGQSWISGATSNLRTGIITGVLLLSGIGIGAIAPAFAQGDATPVSMEDTGAAVDPCPDELFGPDSEPWVRSELYFGTTKDDGTAYTPEEFDAFLDTEITPRFPDGLTLLTGLGQWKGEGDDEVLQERSQLLIILYPPDTARESSEKLEEIRDLYMMQFNESSVLRADAAEVCTSF